MCTITYHRPKVGGSLNDSVYSVVPVVEEAAGGTVGWLHWGGFTLGMEVAAGVEMEVAAGVEM